MNVAQVFKTNIYIKSSDHLDPWTNHIYICNLGTCGSWCQRGDSPASLREGVLRANYIKVVKFDVLFREAVTRQIQFRRDGRPDGEAFSQGG